MQEPDILLIYQLGKVGSSTVYATLKQIYGSERLIHLHFLSDRFKRRAAGLAKYEWHLGQIKRVERLRNENPSSRIKIISLVREPIGRNVSDLFQNPQNYLEKGESLGSTHVDKLIRIYKQKNSYDYTLNWFDNEFRPYTGVDVYQHSFDHSQGFAIFSQQEFDILIIKMESLNSCYKRAFSEFLNLELTELTISNESNSKDTSQLSKQLKSRIRFSEDELSEAYSSKYAQHFYRDDISLLTKKWLKL
jgi:hypothetical protein